MKKVMTSKKLVLALCFVFFAGITLTAQDFEYIGAAKCKMCHNKPTVGAQYKMWSEGPHANAMKTLSSEAALAIAKEKGIADPATDPAARRAWRRVARWRPPARHPSSRTEEEPERREGARDQRPLPCPSP